jgi:hypothetical protein
MTACCAAGPTCSIWQFTANGSGVSSSNCWIGACTVFAFEHKFSHSRVLYTCSLTCWLDRACVRPMDQWHASGVWLLLPVETCKSCHNTEGNGPQHKEAVWVGGARVAPPAPPPGPPPPATTGPASVSYDDSAWDEVQAPHDYIIGLQYDPKNGEKNGFLPRSDGTVLSACSMDSTMPSTLDSSGGMNRDPTAPSFRPASWILPNHQP